ncbi:unnamed protein product [Closterium sp. Naga37s-1]|nr:unnamed protein product [Closterium sp. Naga37s-1]
MPAAVGLCQCDPLVVVARRRCLRDAALSAALVGAWRGCTLRGAAASEAAHTPRLHPCLSPTMLLTAAQPESFVVLVALVPPGASQQALLDGAHCKQGITPRF